jgi:uncharacterized protein (TIGR02145 family)
MKTTTALLLLAALTFTQCKKQNDDIDVITPPAATVTDADGNVYNTIKLGNQVWMLENLKTTKFNDGTPITQYSHAVHGNNWVGLNAPAALYQWAGTHDLNNVHPNPLPIDYYGAMYNHFAIESGKLAPKGWRIPTAQDFITLKNHLASMGFAGKEGVTLKSSSGWHTTAGNGTDAIGFKGLPNGYIHGLGGTTATEMICTWATADANAAAKTRTLVQLYKEDTISIFASGIQIGAGIRCIKE